MSLAPSRPLGPLALPGLTEVRTDPTILGRLPLEVLLDLRRQVGHLEADLDAAIAQHMARGHTQPDLSAVVDVDKAARMLGTSPDSLYRKRKRLRLGYIDPLDGRLKFTEQELADYIRRQPRA